MDNYSSSPVQYLRQQRLLLEIEYNCEKEEFRRQTEAMGLQRKVKRGDAWFPVSVGKTYYNSLNQKAVEVTRTQDTEIEHNFEYGRPVVFFTERQDNNGKDKGAKLLFTGTVSYVDGDRMVVVVADSAPLTGLQTTENVGVQMFFDETTYKLMFDALDRVINAIYRSDIGINFLNPIEITTNSRTAADVRNVKFQSGATLTKGNINLVEDVELPEDQTLTINKGTQATVKGGTYNGTIANNGTLTLGAEDLVLNVKNGEEAAVVVAADNEFAKKASATPAEVVLDKSPKTLTVNKDVTLTIAEEDNSYVNDWGEEVYTTSSRLNTKQMTDFLNNIKTDAASELGIMLPLPDDRFYQAFINEEYFLGKGAITVSSVSWRG